jgi:hypothetical protein
VPQALSELLADANRLEAAWRAGELDPAGARRAVAELDRALSAIARDVAAGGELGRVLGEAGTLVDAARMQLGAGDAPADGADGTVDRDRESSEDEAGGSRDVALAPAGPDGRMSGPRAGDDGAASRPRGYAEPEAGAGVRTWAAEYDDVVARWVELLREDERP